MNSRSTKGTQKVLKTRFPKFQFSTSSLTQIWLLCFYADWETKTEYNEVVVRVGFIHIESWIQTETFTSDMNKPMSTTPELGSVFVPQCYYLSLIYTFCHIYSPSHFPPNFCGDLDVEAVSFSKLDPHWFSSLVTKFMVMGKPIRNKLSEHKPPGSHTCFPRHNLTPTDSIRFHVIQRRIML